MGPGRAKAIFFVMDGGVWLWNIYQDRFEKCSKAMLDFHHFSEHLHALGAALGVPIGSGPVETLCAQFQNRLKRTGQFGTKTGFAALLQVTVRLWNGEMDSLWPLAA